MTINGFNLKKGGTQKKEGLKRPKTAATGTLWTAAKPLFAEKRGDGGGWAAMHGRDGDTRKEGLGVIG